MSRINKELESLHCHTRTSDGTLSYGGILNACQKYNVGVAAFTDHDALPDESALQELNGLKAHPTKFIVGIELSVSHVRELVEEVPLFHIVGLFVDPRNKRLLDHCRERQEERLARARLMIGNLERTGFVITVEDVLAVSEGPSIGRPHIAEALLINPVNRNRLAELVDQEISSGADAELLTKASAKEQLFRLLLGESAIIKGIYVPYNDSLQLDDAVSLIRRSGGVAILAHWTFSKKVLTEAWVERLAREHRLDGIEVVYGVNVTEGKDEIKADQKSLAGITGKYGLLASGGGDIHNEADLMAFSGSALASRTVGMAAEMIKAAKPSLEWSSVRE
ncbi:MAG: PHP domain-containing protein [Patescibacteria group bacterium]